MKNGSVDRLLFSAYFFDLSMKGKKKNRKEASLNTRFFYFFIEEGGYVNCYEEKRKNRLKRRKGYFRLSSLRMLFLKSRKASRVRSLT
jgi:hypothetical protein